MNIGILGGSFDPVHFGHINLAIEVFEKSSLDQIWVVPTQINPFKRKEPPLKSSDRLLLLKQAFKDLSYISIVDDECKSSTQEVSYTVDTLRHFKKSYPHFSFHLILGDDAWKHFSKWKEADTILTLAKIIIASRNENQPSASSLRENIIFLPIRRLEMSSTEIRKRLKEDLYCGHLVPKEVLDTILSNKLYS